MSESFDRKRLARSLGEDFFNGSANGLHLNIRTARADDEVISNRRKIPDFENDKIMRFFIKRSLSTAESFFPALI